MDNNNAFSSSWGLLFFTFTSCIATNIPYYHNLATAATDKLKEKKMKVGTSLKKEKKIGKGKKKRIKWKGSGITVWTEFCKY